MSETEQSKGNDHRGVASLTRGITKAQAALKQARADYERENDRLSRLIVQLEGRRQVALVGVNGDEQERAEELVRVRGRVSESAGGAFEAAVEALADGGLALREGYIGAKRYEAFHQRCDCEYGYGPKHGSIVFAVELTSEARRRMRETGAPLSEAERELAVRYLLARKEADDD